MVDLPQTRAPEKDKPPSPRRYRLEHAGRRFELTSRDVGLGYVARLSVYEEPRDEQTARSERAELHADGFTVRVKWGDFGGINRCVLVERDKDGNTRSLPFEPPPGSHAARVAKFGRERPRLYAARHVLKPALQALLPLLGIGILLTALPPRIDWTWVPAPIRDRFVGDGPDWLEPLTASPLFQIGQWLVPIVIGLLIALNELEKHRKGNRKGAHGPHR